MENILVVDDETEIWKICQRAFERHGYAVSTASNGDEALELMKIMAFDLALLDIRMPGKIDGLELLRRTKKLYPKTEVVMITAEETVETGIEALKIGAFDYILKPFHIAELLAAVKNALAFSRNKTKLGAPDGPSYLFELSGEISRAQTKEALLQMIIERAVTVLKADTGSILMLLPDGDTLKLMSSSGFRAPDSEVRMGDRIAGWVAQNKKPVLIEDLSEFPQFKALSPRKDILSSIVAPLVKHDTLLGVICLNRYAAPGAVKFNRQDLDSLELFAIHSALIIALHSRNTLPKFS